MPTLIGPPHHLYYAALYRRALWFRHLCTAYSAHAGPKWESAKKQLDEQFSSMHRNLSNQTPFDAYEPPSVHKVLNDIPIDSFLHQLKTDMSEYEIQCLGLMAAHGSGTWLKSLEQTSMLWGRQLAQECWLSPSLSRQASNLRTVKGLFEFLHSILQGGEFVWKTSLMRRYTDDELQYELRTCPHRNTTNADRPSAGQVCRLESAVYQGFIQALLPDATYKRHERDAFCMDEVTL
jgi:hypothetical protein